VNQFSSVSDLLNKAGDVAALSLRPSEDGFIVNTTCRLYITCHVPRTQRHISMSTDHHAKFDCINNSSDEYIFLAAGRCTSGYLRQIAKPNKNNTPQQL